MKSWKPRATAQRQTLAVAAAGGASAVDLPEPIQDWLARLFLLYGVPFEYLVPDYRMLPPESIRWAFLDPNWLERAMDGALSIGRVGALQFLADASTRESLAEKTRERAQLVRAQLRGAALPEEISVGGTETVMLIRSAVVGGYPGLEVKGLDSNNDEVALLRMDQLARDVLLVIFEDLPAEVQLIEPPEGLHFGVRRGPVTSCANGSSASGDPAYTFLRSLQAGQVGQQILEGPDHEGVPSQVFFRDDALGVLDVASTVSELECWLGKKDGFSGSLSPAEFGVEMIRAAGLQPFIPSTE